MLLGDDRNDRVVFFQSNCWVVSKTPKPHDPHYHYFCIHHPANGLLCMLLQSQLYFQHWFWKWILSVSDCPLNLYIVLVFMKVLMIQIWPAGYSDWAVFYLACCVFNIMHVMPSMFLATQWNSFWQCLDKVYWRDSWPFKADTNMVMLHLAAQTAFLWLFQFLLAQ